LADPWKAVRPVSHPPPDRSAQAPRGPAPAPAREGGELSRLVLLGAGGDLTGRLLLPALAALLASGQAPRDLHVLGVGQDEWDDGQFRQHCADRLARFAGDVDRSVRDDLVSRLTYRTADVTDAVEMSYVLPVNEPCVVYLALPNVIFADTCVALAAAGVPAGSVLVVEKPFGTDLEDARRLNRLVTEVVPEDQVFRVDHFLAKQTVVNLLGLRFANRIFEPVWNSTHVEAVDIVFDETLGLEGRAGYYDRAGALRDMVQNHLLQVLALVVMEPPVSLSPRDLRDRKVDALRAVRWQAGRADPSSVRGRYTRGKTGDRELPSYVDEPGVDADREAETYAEVIVHVDNWRWAGVPFRLRSGKALAARRQQVVLTFRAAPHLPFPDGKLAQPNRLRLSLDPDAVTLDINVNGPGDPLDLEPAQLELSMPDHELEPYALLLADVFHGDPTLSIRADEAEESWRIVEPILAEWRSGAVPLRDYPVGSHGPLTAGGAGCS
jgi:glucose-6-phosphate 1-dehydrogenase